METLGGAVRCLLILIFQLVIAASLDWAVAEHQHQHFTCSAGYSLFQERQRCYKVGLQAINYIEAKTKCQQDNGDLVTIPDRDTNEFLKDMLTQGQRYYIGMTLVDGEPPDFYQWVDESLVRFEDWYPSEPGGTLEDCVSFNEHGDTYLWRDNSCNRDFQYVCEKDPTEPVVYGATEKWYCPRTYVNYRGSDEQWSCIKAFGNIRANREKAADHCGRDGGKILIVESRNLKSFAAGLMVAGNNYWIQDPHFGLETCTSMVRDDESRIETNPVHCVEELPFLCQHNGFFYGDDDLQKVTSLEGTTFYVTRGQVTYSQYASLCDRHNMSDLASSHLQIFDWMTFDSTAWVGMAKNVYWYKAHLENEALTEFTPCSSNNNQQCCNARSPHTPNNYLQQVCDQTSFGMCVQSSDPLGVCPIGYRYFPQRKRCYRFEAREELNWYDAKKRCENEEAHLAFIWDQQTNDFIQGASETPESYWIGAMKEATDLTFVWIGNLQMTYEMWLESPRSPYNLKDCVFFDQQTGKWTDEYCSTQLSYICERDQLVFPDCPSGYINYAPGQKCFQPQSGPTQTFENARTKCTENGGDIITIPNESVHNFIVDTLIQYVRFWIGLVKNSNHQFDTWIDGTPFSYDNFDTNQPDNNHEKCVDVYNQLGKWNDMYCSTHRHVVCERAMSPASFPRVECPDGHYTQISKTSGRVTCFRVFQQNAQNWTDARQRCQEAESGGDLWVFRNDEMELNDVVTNHLESSTTYWISYDDTSVCQAYTLSSTGFVASPVPCRETWEGNDHGYICQHPGTIKYQVTLDLSNVELADEYIIYHGAPKDVCEASYDYQLNKYDCSSNEPTESDNIIASVKISDPRLYPDCDVGGLNHQCCVTVDLEGIINDQNTFSMTFPRDQIGCLCHKEKEIYTVCPSGYTYYSTERKCLKSHDCKKSFEEARHICMHEGGDLIVIDTQAKSDFIHEAQLTRGGPHWIGLKDKDGGDAIDYSVWIDGTPRTFDNFYDQEPNGVVMTCVLHNKAAGVNGWQKRSCFTHGGFICESRRDTASTTGCPIQGYTYAVEARTCVKAYHKQTHNWFMSKYVCEKEGAHLVTVGTRELKNFLKGDGYLTSGPYYWIGLRQDPFMLNSFETWTDSIESVIVTDWAPGEPHANPEGCLFVNYYNKWRDWWCGAEISFICEQDYHQPNLRCPDGWTMNPTDSMCYQVVIKQETWADAQSYCREHRGSLVSMEEPKTKEYIEGIVKASSGGIFYWIALPKSIELMEGYCSGIVRTNNNVGYYTVHCSDELSGSICKNEPYPKPYLVGCPNGYTQHVTSNGQQWSTKTCLRIVYNQDIGWNEAKDACLDTTGELLVYTEDRKGLQDFVKGRLEASTGYWMTSANNVCMAYEPDGDSHTPNRISCTGGDDDDGDTQDGYICQHKLLYRLKVDLSEMEAVNDLVTSNGISTPVCEAADNLHTDGSSMGEESSIQVDLGDPSFKLGCLYNGPRPECCFNVTLALYPDDSSLPVSLIFPTNGLPCLCTLESSSLFFESSTVSTVMWDMASSDSDIYSYSTQWEFDSTTDGHSVDTYSTQWGYDSTTDGHSVDTYRTQWGYDSTTDGHSVDTYSTQWGYDSTTDDYSATTNTGSNIHPSSDAFMHLTESYSTLHIIDSGSSIFEDFSNPSQTDAASLLDTLAITPTLATNFLETSSLDTTLSPSTTDTEQPSTTFSLPVIVIPPGPPPIDGNDPGTPITTETVEYLKEITEPKENSTKPPQNKLCPCRCSATKVDLNPSPKALSEIVAKIQTRLRVDSTKLASTRNKKESAKDDRASSQSFAYISLFLCAVPFGCIVAADLLMIFQIRDMNK